jgi:hypothetical protein
MATRLPYSRVVDVTITREDRFPTVSSFRTALLLSVTAVTGVVDSSHRTKLYSTMEEVAVDWDAGGETYAAAQRFFQARIRPSALKIGYVDETVFPFTTELDALYTADPDWYWLCHVNDLNDTPAQREIADWAETKTCLAGLDSNDADTETPAAIADSTHAVTLAAASPGVVGWTGHGLIVGDPVRFTTTGVLPTGLTAGTTYYVKTVVDANSFNVAAAPGGTAINFTGSPSGTHTGVALKFGGSIAEYCESKNYDRSAVFYHTDAGSYLAAAAWGYASGRDLDRGNAALAAKGRIDSGQAYTMKFKTLPGVTALNKSSAVVQAVTGFIPGSGIDVAQGHRANTYVNIGGIDMLVEGVVGSGAFIDEIHAVDWIKARTQESVLQVLANNARVPMTNQGVGVLISAGVAPPMRRAFAAGIIAPRMGDDGQLEPEVEYAADDVMAIPASQRRNRIAPDIKVTFRYAGAIHYASVTMTMKF